jgi:protein-S-isoprenylcysteine O-methyltransferase Ste14
MTSKRKGQLLVGLQFLLLGFLILLPEGGNWETPAFFIVMANVLTLLSFIILLVSAINLGKSLTANPVPLDKARLKTTGMYSLVRHPIYSAIVLLAIGRSVSSESFSVLVVAVLLVFLISIKARFEDRLLLKHYEGYAAYAAKVGRMVPGIGRIH